MGRHGAFLDNFWSHVHDSGGPDVCWPWTGARYHDDYGMLGIRNQGQRTTMRAHVMALILATGEEPAGRFGLHDCDNPPCCNPRDLYWGDQKQNIADMDRRGRARRPIMRGEEHPLAKLTDEAVRTIRAAHASSALTLTLKDLADLYGVSDVAIGAVVHQRTWRHVRSLAGV